MTGIRISSDAVCHVHWIGKFRNLKRASVRALTLHPASSLQLRTLTCLWQSGLFSACCALEVFELVLQESKAHGEHFAQKLRALHRKIPESNYCTTVLSMLGAVCKPKTAIA